MDSIKVQEAIKRSTNDFNRESLKSFFSICWAWTLILIVGAFFNLKFILISIFFSLLYIRKQTHNKNIHFDLFNWINEGRDSRTHKVEYPLNRY